MNVLVVSPKFHPIIGGGETYVLNSVKRLHEIGWRISVAVEPISQRKISDYPYNVYELEGLSDDNLNIIPAIANLYDLIEKTKPDIIHAHGYFALMVAGLCNSKHIPIVASIHSTPVWGERIVGGINSFDAELNFARNVIRLSKPCMLTAANKVYSEAAEKIVEGKVKVVVLPYPVDIEFFRDKDGSVMRKQLGINKGDFLILTPSRIIKRKGIKEAILALGELPKNYYLCLPAAIDPLDKEYWKEICSDSVYRQVKQRVLIPKQRVLYEDMPALYAASDIVAMPSYYEGAPVATVEAMAAGKPFVGADAQGTNDFIRNEVNGLLVPPKRSSELTQAIKRLAENSLLQERLSQQARKDIVGLSWDKQLPRLITLYESVYRVTNSMANNNPVLAEKVPSRE